MGNKDYEKVKAECWFDTANYCGFIPTDPIKHQAFDSAFDRAYTLGKEEKDAYYMGEDIKRLLMCEGVYFHPEWTKSKGCGSEHDIAVRYNLERFYAFPDMVPIDEILPHRK